MHSHQKSQQYIRTHIEAPNLPSVEINRNPNAYENFSLMDEKPTTKAHASKMIVQYVKHNIKMSSINMILLLLVVGLIFYVSNKK